MSNHVQDLIRETLTSAAKSASAKAGEVKNSGGSIEEALGAKTLAAGVGAAVIAPLAIKGGRKLAEGVGAGRLKDAMPSPGDALSGAASNIEGLFSSTIKDKVEEAGGPGGIFKEALKSALPFGGGDSDDDEDGGEGVPGVGKGRRMPVQQSVDIGAPLETVYNQFTQFEDWPQFMHRVTRVTQKDDCTVSFAVKIWGRTKEFTAEIETQRPEERIRWRVSQGMTHTGVVSFHELAPNLTRVLLSFDVDPGSLIEKFARGARHVKRAARGDLHRFKAFIEMAEVETGAWRGVIEDGEVLEEQKRGSSSSSRQGARQPSRQKRRQEQHQGRGGRSSNRASKR